MTSRFIMPFADVGSGIKPSSGAKLFFFEINGTTPKGTFSDKAGTIDNTNPVISDAGGVFDNIYITGDYKVTLKDKNDSLKFSLAEVSEVSTGNFDTNLINDLSQAYEFPTVADFKASLITFPDGKTIRLLDRGADFTKVSGTSTEIASVVSTSVAQSIELIKGLAITYTTNMYGLPLVSTGTDEVLTLQDLISQSSFEFIEGFECDTTTLFPQSNTTGQFNNAKLMLPDNSPEGTMVILIGNISDGSQIENCTYYGGIIDGNRAGGNENFNDSSPPELLEIGGGDGGNHGIQIYATRNFKWYSPQTINCGTDGIIVWERSDRYLGTLGIHESVVTDTHIHNPLCDGNRRQGISIVNATDIDIYSPICENTGGATGLPPEAGIDVEGNNSDDIINARFHGEVICRHNDGRGFVMQSDGGIQICTAETITCHDNGSAQTIDGQVVMFASKEDATNTLIANRIHTFNGEGFFSSKGVDAGTKENIIDIDTLICGGAEGRVRFAGRDTVDIASLTARFDASSVGSVALGIATDVLRVDIGRAQVGNSTVSGNSYTFQIDSGDAKVTIGSMKSEGSRAGRILQDGVVINQLDLYGAGLGDMVRVNGAAGCDINIKSHLDSLAGNLCLLENGSNSNKIETYNNGLNTSSINITDGSFNQIVCYSDRVSNDTAINISAGSNENHIYSSHFRGVGAQFVIDSGTDNLINGSFPASVNT